MRICDHQNCTKEGTYKAPKRTKVSVHQNDETWHWFCLEHVRTYNASWNFFNGLTEEEMDKQWKKDVTWDRPSWPLGGWNTSKKFFSYQDPFGLFDGSGQSNKPNSTFVHQHDILLELFQLSANYSEDELQKAYRALVKRFHPDLNKDDPNADEKIRKITEGYQVLKKRIAA